MGASGGVQEDRQERYVKKNYKVTVHVSASSQKTSRQKGLEEQIYFQLVPVYITGNNGKTICTIALQDSASEITVIRNSLAKEIGLKGQEKTLTIRTLNSDMTQSAKMVSFRVKSAQDVDAEPVYVKQAWLVNHESFQCPPQHIRPDINPSADHRN
jgi:hypothetical protein